MKIPLRELGILWHRLVAQSRLATETYFTILPSIASKLPSKMRRQLRNSANAVRWPEVRLRPRQVTVGKRTKIQLYPHFGEFDFEALFGNRLSYEQEVFECLEAHINDYDAIVEIGANVGVFTSFFAASAKTLDKSIRIVAFEPSRSAYLRLLENLRLNKCETIEVFNCAVGDAVGWASFFEPENHLTNGSLNPAFAAKFNSHVAETRVLVVDGAMIEQLISFAKHALIKIDTEGAEARVLRGLEIFIKRHKPDLLIEVLPDYEEDLNNLAFLDDCDYKFFQITTEGLVERKKFVAGSNRDYLLTSSVWKKNEAISFQTKETFSQ
jgi:FkbM family methyltransferase